MVTLIKLLDFPVSGLLAVCFLLVTGLAFLYAGKSKIVMMLNSPRTAMTLLALGAIILAIEGTFCITLHSSIYFALYVFILLTCLSFCVLDSIKQKSNIGFLLNHMGFFLIIWAAFFGAPDVQKMKIVAWKNHPEKIALNNDNKVVILPFSICLDEFIIDYYEDGKSPRQFTSKLTIEDKHMETSVNHPCSYGGYTIYQENYDMKEQCFTVLKLVKDPWLPFIYIGMMMLASGSMILLINRWKSRMIIPVMLVLTILFTILTIAKINFGTLMPALRSWWFVPHLFIYMVAYSLMAMALFAVFISKYKHSYIPEQLMRSSSALLVIGILTGSVWARQAWGDYWTWDPKENWAAVTWFASLIYLHLKDKREVKAIAVIVLSFIALQITWYGVNYLPSAVYSLHTYTK